MGEPEGESGCAHQGRFSDKEPKITTLTIWKPVQGHVATSSEPLVTVEQLVNNIIANLHGYLIFATYTV